MNDNMKILKCDNCNQMVLVDLEQIFKITGKMKMISIGAPCSECGIDSGVQCAEAINEYVDKHINKV